VAKGATNQLSFSAIMMCRTCSELHVDQLAVCDDGDAALAHGVHHKLAVQLLVAAGRRSKQPSSIAYDWHMQKW
jgi:hypothetical protein